MKKYIIQDRYSFFGALAGTFASSAFAVILQFFKGDVLDCAVAGQTGEAAAYGLLLVAFILLEVLFYYLYRRVLAKFVIGCTQRLKADIFRSILGRSFVSYQGLTQGEYIAKYTNQADEIKTNYFDMILYFWEIGVKILFVSMALFLLDWRIALVTLGLLSTPLYLPNLISGRLQRAQTASVEAAAVALTKVNDWLSGFEIIKNYSLESQIMERFGKANSDAMGKHLENIQLGNLSQLITTLISYLSYFIVLACAAWLVLSGDFSAGDFFVSIGMIDQLSYPLISLAQILRQLVAICPVCKDMEEFLAQSPEETTSQLTALESEITFQNVTFGYPGSEPVLQDVNLRIQKGKRYLFHGPSGCGKTTAVNLLLRYFDPSSGTIQVDGKPLSDYGSTYGCITVLRQDAVLFHDSLRNNLTMYQPVSDEVLLLLLHRLGLEKFADPDALDAIVAENGSNFSGGERKRICLARALLRQTDVLILDEPLANLDPETAGRIEDGILSIHDRTVIVVSHQFSREKYDRFHQVVEFGS